MRRSKTPAGDVDWGHGYTRVPNEAFLRDGIAARFRLELRFAALDLLWRCAHQRIAGEVYSTKLGRLIPLGAGECLFGREAFAKEHDISPDEARHLVDRLVALGWISSRSTKINAPSVSPCVSPCASRVRAGCPSVLRLEKWREILLSAGSSAGCPPETRRVFRRDQLEDQQQTMGAREENEPSSSEASEPDPDQLGLWPCAALEYQMAPSAAVDLRRLDFVPGRGGGT